jgi:membrane-associated protease RseP (regulator of RpoE activity)
VDAVSPGQPLPACSPDDPPTPAAEAGLQPGDEIVAIAGVDVTTWDEASSIIRDNGGRTVDIVVLRDGAELVLPAALVTTERYSDPEDPCSDPQQVGFLGVSPTFQTVGAGPGDVVTEVADFGRRTVQAVLGVPERMVGVWQASFGGEERDVCSPVGIVGAGRIGGEIVSADDVGAADRFAGFLALLASFNMAIAVFNLIPLLPLDGGHIAGALWEGLKRAFARVTGRPEPAPVDVAKALPLAYVAAAVLIGMSVLLLYADLVNPVRLPG